MTDVGDVSAPDLEDFVPFDIPWLRGLHKHVERERSQGHSHSDAESLMNIMINHSLLAQINNKQNCCAQPIDSRLAFEELFMFPSSVTPNPFLTDAYPALPDHTSYSKQNK